MAKGKNTTIFFCQNCGYESSKWMGQCPGCKEWNSFVEEVVNATSLKNIGKNGSGSSKADVACGVDRNCSKRNGKVSFLIRKKSDVFTFKKG